MLSDDTTLDKVGATDGLESLFFLRREFQPGDESLVDSVVLSFDSVIEFKFDVSLTAATEDCSD